MGKVAAIPERHRLSTNYWKASKVLFLNSHFNNLFLRHPNFRIFVVDENLYKKK